MLNPGSAKLERHLTLQLNTAGTASVSIESPDPTMQQFITILKGIYGKHNSISGRFYIYNLFKLRIRSPFML
ncbi:hypothetical protein ACH6EH_19525 [Paenibacillus sp. JSM ZJ436]|uniref:hypothetical protein n=1 Tax=Paenibacillus sp. JSM ZJ436 TaxID=3376190 RepID=UPI003791F53A